jgi:hypothetical protein
MSYPEELGGIGPVAKYSHPGPTGACEEGGLSVDDSYWVVVQFAQDLSLRFEMTDYLACHFERFARNLSSLCSAIHSNCITTYS